MKNLANSEKILAMLKSIEPMRKTTLSQAIRLNIDTGYLEIGYQNLALCLAYHPDVQSMKDRRCNDYRKYILRMKARRRGINE